MQDSDFPALYQSADTLSLSSQAHFFLALKLHLAALVAAAITAIVSVQHWSVAYLQLIILLLPLACSIYLFAMRPDRLWYAGRALAESIKTMTWRYVCRAEPFDTDDAESRKTFSRKLKEVIDQNNDVGQSLTKHLDGAQITTAMDRMRACTLEERREAYANSRISDQLAWYANKASYNRDLSRRFFLLLILINSIAVSWAIFRVAHPAIADWPVEILVTVAASILSWMQAKRFSELAASYSLAANEIGIIREQVILQVSEVGFSQFVGDSENAFSREHTQWVARRDA